MALSARFDDVERRTDLPPATQEKTLEADTLDFEKSRVGLGDVYAKQYEQEVLGNKKNPEEDKAKAEVHREGGRVLNA